MKGTIKFIKNTWCVAYDGKNLELHMSEDFNSSFIKEGLLVEFEIIKNPNHSWHNNEPEFLAMLTHMSKTGLNVAEYWQKRCLAAEEYIKFIGKFYTKEPLFTNWQSLVDSENTIYNKD